MTSTVTETTRSFLEAANYERLATGVDAIAVVLLIVLLVEQELIRAYLGPAARGRLQAMNVAAVPLLAAFALIVVLRTLGVR